MQELSERTIAAINILPSASVNSTIIGSLETLRSVTQKLEVVSSKELAHVPLTTEETDFIRQIVNTCGSGGFIGLYVDTLHPITWAADYTSLLDVPVITDVATFPPGDIEFPPQILHAGVSYVNALVVLYPMNNGILVAITGQYSHTSCLY